MRSTKGIIDYASSFKILGVHFFYIGAIIQTFREDRIIELLLSLYYSAIAQIKAPIIPPSTNDIGYYKARFIQYDFKEAVPFTSREQSIIRHESFGVAGEYGQPGARILIWNSNGFKIFNPYASKWVYHIHAIAYLGEDNYAVTTGDTRKYLDIVKINWNECLILKRLRRFDAGYTALTIIDGQLWGGSDFSERSNFIIKITGKKSIFFLPKNCFGEYVIDMIHSEKNEISVITKKLRSNLGHKTIFNTINFKFTQSNMIWIDEVTSHELTFAG